MPEGYGEILKKAREEKNLKIPDIHKILRFDPLYVKALEEENTEAFEKRIYMEMFLRTYARYLKLDAEEIVGMFKKSAGAGKPEAVEKKHPKENIETENREPREKTGEEKENKKFFPDKKTVLIAGGGALAAVILILVLSGGGKGKSSAGNEGKGLYPVEEETSIDVIAKGRGEAWIKARVDEKEEEFLLNKGDKKEWEGAQKIVFLIGNAAGVEFIVNGDSIGVIGEEGEVINGLVFEIGKNWYIDRGQGFKTPGKPRTPEEIKADGEKAQK